MEREGEVRMSESDLDRAAARLARARVSLKQAESAYATARAEYDDAAREAAGEFKRVFYRGPDPAP